MGGAEQHEHGPTTKTWKRKFCHIGSAGLSRTNVRLIKPKRRYGNNWSQHKIAHGEPILSVLRIIKNCATYIL